MFLRLHKHEDSRVRSANEPMVENRSVHPPCDGFGSSSYV